MTKTGFGYALFIILVFMSSFVNWAIPESHQSKFTSTPTITVISPNGGESLAVGSAFDIIWTSTGNISVVNIEFSADNGSSWMTIVSYVANSGSFFWDISSLPSSSCLVRISDALDGDPWDVSDSAFSIVAAQLPTIFVKSIPETGVGITVSPPDIDDLGNGITDFSRTYFHGSTVTLTAPETNNEYSFQKWKVDNEEKTGSTITVFMDGNHTALAIYQPTSYTLTVRSSPVSGALITVTPNDNSTQGDGNTEFSRTYNSGTEVTLIASASHKGRNFVRWLINGTKNTNRTIQVTMDKDHIVQAVYQSATYTLSVRSSPDTGVGITVSPDDNYNNGNGNTDFTRTYDSGATATLTAPETNNDRIFQKWVVDNTDKTGRTITVTMNSDHTANAVYQLPTYKLTVQSFPSTGVNIIVNPIDNNGNGNGATNFTRTYNSSATVTLSAPLSASDSVFSRWTVDGKDMDDTNGTIQVTIDSNHSAVAHYEMYNPPQIYVNRSRLNFGYVIGSSNLPVENFTVSNSGGSALNWNVSCDHSRVILNPTSGINYDVVEVTIDTDGLIPGMFDSKVRVSDSEAANSPVEVELKLWVKARSESSPPFGAFSTPVDGSTVSGSVPVTGWVLGDTGIESVKIYREWESNLVFIGDAILVEGARPDIEAEYSDYPMNYSAGWGYMMLTNFFPNGGNGVFKIHAIAMDKEGRTSTLGVNTITIDNTNAVKPFGAIDTPSQGGTASGSSYRNHGWVLTPPPNKIPEDGSTISVYVDGVNLGYPVYNLYRSDIAELFPGFANSNGSHGYFNFDTTAYPDGVHSIFWTVEDDAGNADGIGSRFFTILNSQGAGRTKGRGQMMENGGQLVTLSEIPINYSGFVKVNKGFKPRKDFETIYPDENGIKSIEIKELNRLEIHLDSYKNKVEPSLYTGYSVVGDQLKPLPIGSTLDTTRGIFYWQPGVGFQGDYEFVFLNTAGNEPKKIKLTVRILPKFSKQR